MKKFINVTHNDLDGIGCSVVASYIARQMNLEFINYNVKIGSQGKLLSNIIENINNESENEVVQILVSDIGISAEIAEKLDTIQHSKSLNINIAWIDHHITNTTVAHKYEWAMVRTVDESGVPISATKLMVSHFKGLLSVLPAYNILASFANIVSRYDTWEWKNNPSHDPDKSEEDLNILFQDLGVEKAIRVFSNIINENKSPEFELPEQYTELVRDRKEERQRFVDNAVKRSKSLVWLINPTTPYAVRVLIPKEKYFNAELTGVYESDSFKEDFVVGLVPQNHSVALRTNRKDINLAEIAAKLGGGGHRSAAGAILPIKEFLGLLEKYYNTLEMTAE